VKSFQGLLSPGSDANVQHAFQGFQALEDLFHAIVTESSVQGLPNNAREVTVWFVGLTLGMQFLDRAVDL